MEAHFEIPTWLMRFWLCVAGRWRDGLAPSAQLANQNSRTSGGRSRRSRLQGQSLRTSRSNTRRLRSRASASVYGLCGVVSKRSQEAQMLMQVPLAGLSRLTGFLQHHAGLPTSMDATCLPDFGPRNTVQGCHDDAVARTLARDRPLCEKIQRRTLGSREVAQFCHAGLGGGGQALKSSNLSRKATHNQSPHLRVCQPTETRSHSQHCERIAQVEETQAHLLHKRGETGERRGFLCGRSAKTMFTCIGAVSTPSWAWATRCDWRFANACSECYLGLTCRHRSFPNASVAQSEPRAFVVWSRRP